jgi:hypothetical protein
MNAERVPAVCFANGAHRGLLLAFLPSSGWYGVVCTLCLAAQNPVWSRDINSKMLMP